MRVPSVKALLLQEFGIGEWLFRQAVTGQLATETFPLPR
jgi:hypothetical protein